MCNGSALAAASEQRCRGSGRVLAAAGWSCWSYRCVCMAVCVTGTIALSSNNEALSAADLAGRPLLMPLHRQTVPIAGSEHVVNVYFGTIRLGGGATAQEFSVIFDTGSGHVVVPSSACTSPSCLRHRRYNRAASPQAVGVGVDGNPNQAGELVDEVTVEFGTGEITGQFARETVCLAGDAFTTDSSAPTVSDHCVTMNVLEAVAMSDEPFDAFAFDGILGLGLHALALAPEFSFFNQLIGRGNVTSVAAYPQFAIFLGGEGAHDNEDGNCGWSELAIGGYNAKRLQGPLSWAPVADPDEGYWQVKILGVRVGNRTLKACKTAAGCHGIVDTGSSMIGAPASAVGELEAALSVDVSPPASSAEARSMRPSVNCISLLGEDRQLHLDIEGGMTLTLDPKDYASRSPSVHEDRSKDATAWWWRCGPLLAAVGHSVVGSDDQSSTDGQSDASIDSFELPELFILGEPVLRRYYAVFDWSGPSVGFGEATRCSRPDSTDNFEEDLQFPSSSSTSFPQTTSVVHEEPRRGLLSIVSGSTAKSTVALRALLAFLVLVGCVDCYGLPD